MGHLQYTASLQGRSGQRISLNTLPHCWEAVGCGTPSIPCLTVGSSGPWISLSTLPNCWGACGAVGSGTPSICSPTAGEHLAMDLFLRGMAVAQKALDHGPG